MINREYFDHVTYSRPWPLNLMAAVTRYCISDGNLTFAQDLQTARNAGAVLHAFKNFLPSGNE